jgi:hypothetical protein
MYDLANENVRDVVSSKKLRACVNFIRGIIHNENYYLATQYIPTEYSSSSELQLYNEIISHFVHSKIFTHIEDINSHEIVKIVNDSAKGWKGIERNFEKSYGADYEIISGDDIVFDSFD